MKLQRATVAYILDNLGQVLACSKAAYVADRPCLEHSMAVEFDWNLEPADFHWSYCY